jgi:hypothetical protein
MKKNILLLLVLILIGYQIVIAQIKYYTATGRDSISYVATNQGLLILKRDSTQTLRYYSLINDSNKVYKRSLDNENYLILGTNSSIDIYSLSNKLLPKYINSLKITNIISLRPFGDNFAIIREGNENIEQYILGNRNDSIKILDSIKSVGITYTGKTAFYPEVVYPYFFGYANSSAIVMYKFVENEDKFEFIDTLNVISFNGTFGQIFGANTRLFILEYFTNSDPYQSRYSIDIKKYSINNDTLNYISTIMSYSSGIRFIDEIECTDTLIRYNSGYTYLNSSTSLTEPNNYFYYTTSLPLGLSGDKIYQISYDGSLLYYSTEILDDTIYSAKFIYNPTSINNNISQINEFALYQNYPNPFNPLTTISFYISKSSLVKLQIFNILGKEIEIIINSEMKPGNYSLPFNAKNLSSGIYFYRLTAGSYTSTKKMVILK